MKESWKAINELLYKRSKSSSIDCLKESGTETLNKKDVSNAMTNLTFLFNTSIETNQFRDCSWQVTEITPIYKDRNRTDKSNYRPISVLLVI